MLLFVCLFVCYMLHECLMCFCTVVLIYCSYVCVCIHKWIRSFFRYLYCTSMSRTYSSAFFVLLAVLLLVVLSSVIFQDLFFRGIEFLWHYIIELISSIPIYRYSKIDLPRVTFLPAKKVNFCSTPFLVPYT